MNSTFTFSDCFSTLFVFIGRGLGVDCDAFNWCLSKMRQCIERAFGLMVQRWGILWRSLRVTFSSMPKVLLAVARLHNFCITVKDTPPNTRYHGDSHEDDIFRVIMNRNHLGDGELRRPLGLALRADLTRDIHNRGITRPPPNNYSRAYSTLTTNEYSR